MRKELRRYFFFADFFFAAFFAVFFLAMAILQVSLMVTEVRSRKSRHPFKSNRLFRKGIDMRAYIKPSSVALDARKLDSRVRRITGLER